MGSCECPGKRRRSWEGEGSHHNSPYFSLPRHKVNKIASKDKSRNSSSDISVSLCNFIKHYKQGFISVWMKISSCPPCLCTNHFFGKKQSQEGPRPRQRALGPGQCPPGSLGPLFCPIYALQSVLPLVFKSSDIGD